MPATRSTVLLLSSHSPTGFGAGDPFDGSVAVESLTDELESEAVAYIEGIREMGDGSMRDGVQTGIEQECPCREIREATNEYQ